jgi:glucose-6-phosphate isomerase
MENLRGATIRVLSTWGKGLEAAGLWYDQLLSESLGKKGQGAMPLTVVNTRDLHSRGQQHQEGRRDKLITNVIVDKPQRRAIAIEKSKFDQDKLNELAGKPAGRPPRHRRHDGRTALRAGVHPPAVAGRRFADSCSRC